MKLSCPSCGALMSLDVVVAHDGAREAVQAALQLPAPLGKHLIQYLTLFRPAKRQLTLDKLSVILNELLPMVQAGEIRRDGKVYLIPISVWVGGLQEMMDRHKAKPFVTPLKSHGYLLEVLIGRANSAEAKAEAKRERDRQQPPAREQAKRSQANSPQQVSQHIKGLKDALYIPTEAHITFDELRELARQKELQRLNQEETQ